MSRRAEVAEYLIHLEKERDVSPHTVKAYGRDLDAFTEFCNRHYGDWGWSTVDRLGLRGFLGELQRKGLARRSAARALSAVRSLYRFLQEHHGVPNTIARAARMPKLEKRLPSYMDRQQTTTLFEWAESRAGGDEFGPTRDLAILELFYSTGIRLSELCGMNLEDLDLLADQAKVRGKGRKERIVPVGSRAVLALRRYLQLREPVVARQKGDRRGRRTAGALAPSYLCHPLAGCRRRSPGSTGAAGPRIAEHDPDLYAYQRRAAQESVQPGPSAGMTREK
jgi:integrase/recombinase XerC